MEQELFTTGTRFISFLEMLLYNIERNSFQSESIYETSGQSSFVREFK